MKQVLILQIGGWDKELTGIYVAKFEAGFPEGNNDTASVKSSQSYTEANAYIRNVELGLESNETQTARNWLDGVYGETPTKISYPVFQPLTYSMNYINNNDVYNLCRVINEQGNIYGFTTSSSDTHLMKNSEWGMVSYLSYSNYGTKGKIVTMNNANLNSGGQKRTVETGKNGVDSVYAITGMTGGTTDGEEIVVKIDEIRTLTGNTPTATGSMYSWNQKNGTKASTTGNMTGVYDMSGGIWEKTASYIANENVNMINYGKSMTYEGDILKTTSTKYTMVYPHNSDIDNKDIDNTLENLATASIANYNLNTKIYGDGIREVSTSGLDATTWKGEYSHFIGLYGSFMYRSGAFWDSPYTGILAFHRDGGYSNFGHGFRPVVIPI